LEIQLDVAYQANEYAPRQVNTLLGS